MKTVSGNEKSYREVTTFNFLKISYASSVSYILWRPQCSFTFSGRCQIVSSIALVNSMKKSIPVTNPHSITSAIFSERGAHAFVLLLCNTFSDCSAGSLVALSFSCTANRWLNCCTAVSCFTLLFASSKDSRLCLSKFAHPLYTSSNPFQAVAHSAGYFSSGKILLA